MQNAEEYILPLNFGLAELKDAIVDLMSRDAELFVQEETKHFCEKWDRISKFLITFSNLQGKSERSTSTQLNRETPRDENASPDQDTARAIAELHDIIGDVVKQRGMGDDLGENE